MLQANRDPDLNLMRRCIALAEPSINEGEYPFAAVIARGGELLCESINRIKRDHNLNSHVEIVAISQAQLTHGTNLSDCTIYATVEPCALCSYAIREARIGKVVYGLRSPLMGGHSRWNILSDTNLSAVLPEVFLPALEIVPGFLQNEVEAVCYKWKPLIWQVIKARRVFVGNIGENASTLHPQSFTTRLTRLIRTFLIDRIRQV